MLTRRVHRSTDPYEDMIITRPHRSSFGALVPTNTYTTHIPTPTHTTPLQIRAPITSYHNPTNSAYVPFYHDGIWTRHSSASAPPLLPGRHVQLYTFNLSSRLHHPIPRLLTLLIYLKNLPLSSKPTVIHLQEFHRSALPTLLENLWIQRRFAITDIIAPVNSEHFTLTLVSLDLQVQRCYRCRFSNTDTNRDMLVTDIAVAGGGVLRFVNVQLETKPISFGRRYDQLREAAMIMRAEGARVRAAVLAGDSSAAWDEEEGHARKVGLNDAGVLGEGAWRGGEGKEKVLYRGAVRFTSLDGEVLAVKKVAVGLTYSDGKHRRRVSENGGLVAMLTVGDGRW